MAKNIELLKRLRTRFLRMRHKEHFDIRHVAKQNVCGTAMCIAGHTLDLAGYKHRFRQNAQGQIVEVEWFDPSGRRLGADPLVRARRLLGLSKRQADHIGYDDADCGMFYDFRIQTPKQAADRIEKIIAEAQS